MGFLERNLTSTDFYLSFPDYNVGIWNCDRVPLNGEDRYA